MKERENYKGDVNILRPPHLLPAIRRQKHKSKRVHACTYNFECDWLIVLSDNNLASELVENSGKSDERAAQVQFVNHEYDYRPNWRTRSLITN